MQFNIIFKTIFEYIHQKFRFMHTNTFCKYRKNYSHRLACILLLLQLNVGQRVVLPPPLSHQEVIDAISLVLLQLLILTMYSSFEKHDL